mgnify:CR=1 FL=1
MTDEYIRLFVQLIYKDYVYPNELEETIRRRVFLEYIWRKIDVEKRSKDDEKS